jgi:hypothetical protein
VPTSFTDDYPIVLSRVAYLSSGNSLRLVDSFFVNTSVSGRLEGLRIYMQSGNITSGTITLYGVKR